MDYAQLQKICGGGPTDEANRYSPAKCLGTERRRIVGDPDRRHVSTSYVGHQNLTMRMSMKRFARLTNAFSKKAETLAAAVALHFMHYNFSRPHQSLRGATPTQAAGVAKRRWTAANIVGPSPKS